MAKKPEVTFILGIRNAARTLDECLASILSQKTRVPFEILIIDGKSEDETLQIVHTYQKKYPSLIRLMHNPARLSEGKGMSKDMGVHSARGNIVIFIDHDNILTHPTWLNAILAPFEDQTIVASQSLLTSRPGDSLFLQYVNEVGVEDPFAIPYSIVAQAQLHPSSFVKQKKWLRYTLDPRFPLFGGANGCAFRKSIFKTIGGYTRDVDVFASLSEQKAVVALVPGARIHHKTSATLSSYLYKKGVYFVRFMKQDMRAKQFNWVPPTLEGKCWFIGYVFLNLTLLMPFFWGLFKALTTARLHWLFHPLYVWLITAEYCILGLLRLPSLLAYSLRFSRYKKNIQS